MGYLMPYATVVIVFAAHPIASPAVLMFPSTGIAKCSVAIAEVETSTIDRNVPASTVLSRRRFCRRSYSQYFLTEIPMLVLRLRGRLSLRSCCNCSSSSEMPRRIALNPFHANDPPITTNNRTKHAPKI